MQTSAASQVVKEKKKKSEVWLQERDRTLGQSCKFNFTTNMLFDFGKSFNVLYVLGIFVFLMSHNFSKFL